MGGLLATCRKEAMLEKAGEVSERIVSFGTVGTLRGWHSLADRMCMLITSDLCAILRSYRKSRVL